MTIPEAAIEANARGLAAKGAGDFVAAEAAFKEAIALASDYEHPWFNVGVIYKWQARWAEAREAMESSLALQPDDNGPAWWNLGIAATATGDWSAARSAWRAYGIKIPDGDGPLDMALGRTPVRLLAEEVVWCRRIDPARAIIESIPMPESGRRHGDLLVHDGEPKGHRIANGESYSVFNELALLTASDESTFEATISAPSPEDTDDLGTRAEKAGLVFEDWTANVRMICQACSEGTPHEHAPGSAVSAWAVERRCAFAARDEAAVREVLRQWSTGRALLARLFSGRKCERIERVLQ
jgi:hypothetical protein